MILSVNRRAFTLVELIFVIIVLGIVASIGSELIVKIYGQYIVQRAQYRASVKTELAALQIANRLAAAIPGTIVRRLTTTGPTEDIDGPMLLDTTGNNYTVLQWVGADMDSFNYYDSANKKVGWSGFCDVDGSNKTLISTPGSKLTGISTIIGYLSGGSPPASSPAIYFPHDQKAYPATLESDSIITLTGAGATHIVEHYKLAWSSYAITIEDGDLYLHYNFTPKTGTDIPDEPKSLLMKDISTFKFKGAGRTIRFKICKEEQIGENYTITACKEKAIF